LADPVFRRLMVCRVLVALSGLSGPFYVLHASEMLNLPQTIIGSFVVAQTLSGVVTSAALGFVVERWGPQHAIRIGTAIATTGPAFALAAHVSGSDWLARAYPFVYVGLGVVNSLWMMGFFNYLLEVAPVRLRPAYIGTANTIMGPLTLTPIIGGWLLDNSSYPALFAIAAVLALAGFLLSTRLKSPRLTSSAENRA
jgi:hypothetical protein